MMTNETAHPDHELNITASNSNQRRRIPIPPILPSTENDSVPKNQTPTSTDAIGGQSASLNTTSPDPTTVEPSSASSSSHQRMHTLPATLCDTPSLFVGGLHPRICELHLQKLFSPYGTIVRIHIVTHNSSNVHGTNSRSEIISRNQQCKPNTSHNNTSHRYASNLQQSKGYAFVEYNSIESARTAMSRLDGRSLMGRTLAVRPSRKRKVDGGSSGNASRKACGAGAKTTEEARREYGAVESKIEAVKRAIEQKKRGLNSISR